MTQLAKNALRQSAYQERASVSKEKANKAATVIAGRIAAYIQTQPDIFIIAGYFPISDELDILPALQLLQEQKYATALPVILGVHEPLEFHAWKIGELTQPSAIFRRVYEPVTHSPPIIPDIILVPFLAFDKKGHRLGYGGGFYDRTLHAMRSKEAHPLTIGVGYDIQQTEEIPVQTTDQCLDVIITESQVLTFARQ